MTETLAMLLPIYYSLTIDTKFFAKLSGNFHFSKKMVFIFTNLDSVCLIWTADTKKRQRRASSSEPLAKICGYEKLLCLQSLVA